MIEEEEKEKSSILYLILNLIFLSYIDLIYYSPSFSFPLPLPPPFPPLFPSFLSYLIFFVFLSISHCFFCRVCFSLVVTAIPVDVSFMSFTPYLFVLVFIPTSYHFMNISLKILIPSHQSFLTVLILIISAFPSLF